MYLTKVYLKCNLYLSKDLRTQADPSQVMNSKSLTGNKIKWTNLLFMKSKDQHIQRQILQPCPLLESSYPSDTTSRLNFQVADRIHGFSLLRYHKLRIFARSDQLSLDFVRETFKDHKLPRILKMKTKIRKKYWVFPTQELQKIPDYRLPSLNANQISWFLPPNPQLFRQEPSEIPKQEIQSLNPHSN